MLVAQCIVTKNLCLLFVDYCKKGILCDKNKTEILGVPYRIKTMEVPASVKKVQLPEYNQIQQVQFKAETMDDLPEVSFSSFHDCQIIVSDQILDEFLEAKGSALSAQGCVISAASDPNTKYTVQKKMAIDQTGRVSYVFSNCGASCNLLPDAVSIGQTAFRNAASVTTLLLKGEQTITLEKDCLKDTQIRTILCKNQQQIDSLEKQLSYAGKTDIILGLSAVTADGYTYYTETKDGQTTVTLLSVPENITDFNGTIDQGKIRVNEISTEAFSGSHVVWVTLSEETTVIGPEAFKDCKDLQGVLIDTREKITIGDEAFEGCSALRFVASNAAEAAMQNGYDPVITSKRSNFESNCFYVLPNATGYGEHSRTVTGVSGLECYVLDEITEESRILYGLDGMGNQWIAVRSGSLLPDELNLPDSVSMIMDCAFADTHTASGSCKVNLDQLYFLSWIEKGAFANSDIAGDISVGAWRGQLILNSEAFAECKNLTGVTVYSRLILLGESVFENCGNLEVVDLKSLGDSASIQSGIFTNCNNLKELRLYSKEPPRRTVYGETAFRFNGSWTQEEEAEHLRIKVPEGAEETYVMEWRYLNAGYTGAMNAGNSAFLDMWNGIRDELLFTYWVYPEDSEVDALVKERLCTTENCLRKMLGIKEVGEATDLYIWHQNDIYLSLASVPSYIKETDLETATLDMPEGWTLDTIEADAFAGARKIEKVEIPSTLVGISANAFRGISSGKDLTLKFKGDTPPQLMDATKDDPFVFGLQESRLHIQVPDGAEKSYIQSWVYPLSGYTDEAEVLAEAQKQIEQDTGNNTEEKTDGTAQQEDTEISIRRKAAEILLPTENRLRRMMGLDELNTIDDGMLCMEVPKDESREAKPEVDPVTEPDTSETEEAEVPGTEEKTTDSDKEAAADASEVESQTPENTPEDDVLKDTSKDTEMTEPSEKKEDVEKDEKVSSSSTLPETTQSKQTKPDSVKTPSAQKNADTQKTESVQKTETHKKTETADALSEKIEARKAKEQTEKE